MAQEILMPQTSGSNVVNFSRRDATALTVVKQQLVVPQGLVDSNPIRNNYSLVPGHYGDYVNIKPAVLGGVPGTTLGTGSYKSTVQATNIEHLDHATLHATAIGQWANSKFTSIKCTPGTKARFVCCSFSGVVDNAGGNPLDVVLVGCFMAVPPINVTIIG